MKEYQNGRGAYKDLLFLTLITVMCSITLMIPIYQNSSLLLIPRDTTHLGGIFFTAFFHADIQHLIANLAVLLPVSLCIIYVQPGRYRSTFLKVSICSGLLLWCVGSPGIHLGASGVAIGLCFYIVFRGMFIGSWPDFVIATILTGYNLLLFINFWKLGEGVSSDYHICGAFSGVVMAIFNTKALRKD